MARMATLTTIVVVGALVGLAAFAIWFRLEPKRPARPWER